MPEQAPNIDLSGRGGRLVYDKKRRTIVAVDSHAPLHVQEGSSTHWKRWFAWRPVKTEQGQRIWLRSTWRRRFYPAPWFIMEAQGGWWEYSDDKRGRWGF